MKKSAKKFSWVYLSAGLLVLFAVAAALAPGGNADLSRALMKPQADELLGTDALGRPLWLRVGQGLGLSLWVGLWASAVAVVIGTLYGATAALVGGRAGRWMMRLCEVVNALPLILFVVLVGLYAGRSLVSLFVALGAVGWTTLARMVRAQLLKVRQRDFVMAARTMGAPSGQILLKHLLPHTASVVLVYAMLNLPAILILEATLSYLGLGVQPPQASLGVLLSEGAAAMSVYPWLLWVPAGAFVWMLSTVYALGERWRKKLAV